MIKIKRLILGILKPHQPNALEFAEALAELGQEIMDRSKDTFDCRNFGFCCLFALNKAK